jgi:hypothetical protein
MTKEKILKNIDFKELSKSCKDEKYNVPLCQDQFVINFYSRPLHSLCKP